jgi:hypothetical protein
MVKEMSFSSGGSPLGEAGPSSVGGILSIVLGLGGIAYILFNIVRRKDNDTNWWKISFGLSVFLFFVIIGVGQLLEVR